MSFDLLISGIVTGLLLGGFYAALSSGLQISFGLLDVPHVAYPAFLVVGSYGAVALSAYGIDPLLAGLLLAPLFFIAGALTYRFYYVTFESRGTDQGLRGLAFFFGIAFIIEVLLIMSFGVDQRMVEAPYIGSSVAIGDLRLPTRMIVAFGVAVVVTGGLMLYMSRTFMGRAIRAVAQEPEGLALMGAYPVRIRQWAFALSTAIAGFTGALIVVIGPVEPGMGWLYLGRIFAVVVLGGLGSLGGTLIAGLALGVSENVVLSSIGSSWTPAVSFGMLLLVLVVRPNGLFGRA